MQKAGPQNNIYMLYAAQQQAGFAQHAQLTDAYHASQQIPTSTTTTTTTTTTGSNGRGRRSGAPNGIAGW